jgi:hypothetical protein
MNVELQDLFATVRRLDDLRVQSPRPLASHEVRQRDGPDNRYPDSFRPPGRVTGQIRPSQRISKFSYRSREKS